MQSGSPGVSEVKTKKENHVSVRSVLTLSFHQSEFLNEWDKPKEIPDPDTDHTAS